MANGALNASHIYRRFYEGLNNRLRFFGGDRLASYCRPTSISILLTELCNARCLHCDIWKNKGREDSPSVGQWKAVLRDLREWLGPVQVTLTGGEALLKPFAIDLVAYGSEIGLAMELLSHGYWDDQSKFERLARAMPWRITFSLDGLGETHTRIRGRENFFEKTTRSIATLQRVRAEQSLGFRIRLKTVIMEHNLDDLCELARFASQPGMDVLYQPIEQNYNTPDDPTWYLHSENWPRSPERAVSVIEQLMAMKRQGSHIANSYPQLNAMIDYFRNPASLRVAVQSHNAHERRRFCSSLINLQIHANGDVRACVRAATIGNVKEATVRDIWEQRPRVWKNGCCLEVVETDVVQISQAASSSQ
jgi:MoaA/NifB/PqqE/SkfB family radical SAM enzyme